MRPIYENICLWRGNDCHEFNTIGEAALWLVENKYAKNEMAARTGISHVLTTGAKRYLGFEISAARYPSWDV